MKSINLSVGIPLLLLQFIFQLCMAQDTFYVTPSENELTCDGRAPCNTLSGYTAANQNGPFDSIPNSNVTLIFLPGCHFTEDISVIIFGIASFTMSGDPEFRTEINCTHSLRFGFVNIGEVSVSDLTFHLCGLDVAAVEIFVLSSSAILNHELRSAVFITSSSIIAIRSCNFSGNSGGRGDGGGAISVISTSVELTSANFSDNNFTRNIAGVFGRGGGVFIDTITAVFSGTNIFMNNFSPDSGGGMVMRESIVAISGTNTFIGNQANSGGALIFSGSLDVNGIVRMAGNLVTTSGGGIFMSENSSLLVNGAITFEDNVAIFGGGMWVECNNSVQFRGRTIFRGHVAVFGGAVAGTAFNISLDGDTTIEDNLAMYGGGIGTLFNSMLTLRGNANIDRNIATTLGGGIMALSSIIIFSGEVGLLTNLANQDGGGCVLSRSILSIEGNTTFDNNAAGLTGGGIVLSGDSEIVFQPFTEVRFSNNSANRGGAIAIDDSIAFTYCVPGLIPVFTANKCFYQFPSHGLQDLPPTNVAIILDTNDASEAGADFYGGLIDICYLTVEGREFNPPPGRPSFIAVVQSKDNIRVSSDPIRVCVCEDEIANCSIESVNRRVFPGGTVQVIIVALGQRNGTVPALVQAEVVSGNKQDAAIERLEASQPIKNTCSSIKYTVLAGVETNSVTIQVYPRDGPCQSTDGNVSIIAEILPCPVGFEFSQSQQACTCDSRLVEEGFTTICNISDQIIHRNGEFWMGFDSEKGLILHPHCPLDYCISEAVDVPIDKGDIQCDNNRAGLICGQCNDGFSLSLGSSECRSCTDAYLALLIVFFFAGLALVVSLWLFNLTVSEGTINALIFYANIVHVNEAIFFPRRERNFLRVFIAWLNLDLGIETCFYDGMDAYAKAWLQFVFPFYVWAIVFGFIIIGHFSARFAKSLGSNPVTILATLFLLSYTKVLRAITVPLSVTKLSLADSSEAVWLADGNVRYLQGKHIPLFLFSLAVLVFVFLPFTFFLFFGQWIQRLKMFHWMNGTRIRAFLDAYWAPYTPKHRYWTGLLLFLRCILFLVSAFGNARGDSGFNVVIIGCVCLGLAVVPWLSFRIYKKWYLQVLEAFFILNLGVLAVASSYIVEVRRSDTDETVLTSFSAGIAFVQYIGIVIFHVIQRLRTTSFWSRAVTYYLEKKGTQNSGGNEEVPGATTTKPNTYSRGDAVTATSTTWSEVELAPQEAQFSQLREPVLDYED